MSRLDQHVRLVQSKMVLDTWLRAPVWAGIIFFSVLTLAVIVQRVIAHYLPHPAIWFWAGAGLSIAGAIVYAMMRRPTLHEAAVAIDDRLALKEKFSTALYVRPSKDPFAIAAVKDAEKTADKVTLHKKFPLQFPRQSWVTGCVALVALLAWWKMPECDVFGAREQQIVKQKQKEAQVVAAENVVKKAIAAIESAPKEVLSDEQIKLAAPGLPELFKIARNDPTHAAQVAQDTLKQIEAVKQKIKDEKNFATAKNELNSFKNMQPPSPQETGPVADAHRALSEGKLEEAVDDLKKAVDNFDKMDKAQQEKAAQQMQQLAQKIQQQANNPQVQQQIQQQLQQAGVNQQQAQQMQQLMQQAANGNQQAAQQLQQMANQAIQQANQQQGKGQSQQQQQQTAQAIQKAVQQAQQQANAQANAQAMQQAAGQLAQAMQQAAGQKQQPGGQGSKSNGQAGQGQQQQMAQAAQAMQQQMQQLAAQANGAAGIAAGQQGGQAGNQGQGGQQNQNGQMAQQNGQWGNNQQQQGQPQPQQGQGGQGGPAVAQGGKRPDPVETPFGTKEELSQSQTDDKGKILASSFVKAPAEKGSSKMSLSQVAESEMKEATDEVQQERIPRGAWKAVKGYFDTLKTEQPSGK
jgi:hypothetical protein